jgi:hypothetical protein
LSPIEPHEGASGGSGRRDDSRNFAIVTGIANGGDRQSDDRAEVNDGRAIETSSGQGPDRALRSQRRVASGRLTIEEIADLPAPGPARNASRWTKPLVVYDFPSVKE